MKQALAVLISVAIAGCASSGVVPTGPDAYVIAMSEWGFTSGAVHAARLTQEASDYCKNIGKQIQVIDIKKNDLEFGKTPAAEVRFQCLK